MKTLDEISAYTYDVVFNDENDSNSKGWQTTLQECRDYINNYNGTNESYFEDYKGGTVSIVCNETGETVYEVPVKDSFNEEDMEEINDYAVIRDIEGVNHIVGSSEIKRGICIHSLVDGTAYTSYDAGDYSLYNQDGDAVDDMKEEGVKIFGEDFRNIRYTDDFCAQGDTELDNRFIITNAEDLDLEDRVEEMEAFMAKWEEENAEYTTCDAYTYWDGSNKKSIILDGEEYEELPDCVATEMIKSWLNLDEEDWSESAVGCKTAERAGFRFEMSQWESDWGLVTVEKM